MTSIMRFDQWQNSLGQQYNTVLQVANAKDSGSAVSSSASWSTQLGVTLTSKMANSKFLITAHVYMGYTMSVAGNADVDNYAVGLGRNGTTLLLDTRGSSYITDGFVGSDVPMTGGGTYAGQYDVGVKSVTYLDSPQGPAGTSYTYNILFRNPYATGVAYYNRSANGAGSGGMSTITVMEIAQ